MLSFTAILCVVAIASATSASGAAIIVADKTIEAQGFAVGLPFSVTVKIYNIGTDAAAHDVEVLDQWPDEYFEVREGHLHAKFDAIGAGEHVSHSYVLVPKKEAQMQGFPAVVAYHDEASEKVLRVVSSQFYGQASIISAELYAKISDKHYWEYGVFGAAAAILVGLPLLGQLKYSLQYTHGVPNAMLPAAAKKIN